MVMELARLEEAGQLVLPTRLPPLPDGGGPALWAWAQDAIKAVFPGFLHTVAQAVSRGNAPPMELVELTLAEGQVQIEFEMDTSERDGTLRDLFCFVSTGDDSLRSTFDGAPVWLQSGDQGPAVQERALDELGGVAFYQLSPGQYALRLHLAGREYVVSNIVLP